MNFEVEPRTVTFERTIKRIHITVEQISLFSNISFIIRYLDQDGYLIDHASLPSQYVLEKEEYRNWGDDDQYVLQKIYEFINSTGMLFVIIPEVPPEVVPV